MNLFDDAGLGGCVRAAPEPPVSERELIVRLRIAGREFGRASEMFDGGGRLNVPGIEVCELFPKVARQMNHAALLRGMSTGEGAHGRAKYYLHTGYKEGIGGLNYPSLGSIVSAELGRPEFPLPNFVSIGNRSYGAGFLGARHQPIIIGDPTGKAGPRTRSCGAAACGRAATPRFPRRDSTRPCS